MINNLVIRKADVKDMALIQDMIKSLAIYEKRPQDATGTAEQLKYWLFDKKIATFLIAEADGVPIGYAIYYPIFASFSAAGKVHLEDFLIKEEYRGQGIGRYFLSKIVKIVIDEGYFGMEWSFLDWNKSAIDFYNKIGAKHETGREYFELDFAHLNEIAL